MMRREDLECQVVMIWRLYTLFYHIQIHVTAQVIFKNLTYAIYFKNRVLSMKSVFRVWDPSAKYEIRVPSMKSVCRVWNPSAESEIRVPSMKSECRVWNPCAEYEIRVPSMKSECRVWNTSAEYHENRRVLTIDEA